MERISGISKVIAKNIVAYREENGRFLSRKELLKVPKLGPKAFEQCAGFMRISDGKEALDATSIHPESYEAASMLGYSDPNYVSALYKKLFGHNITAHPNRPLIYSGNFPKKRDHFSP
jgi:transcriptional accessory protein Tex/SPT6